jgi:hypothetical protein
MTLEENLAGTRALADRIDAAAKDAASRGRTDLPDAVADVTDALLAVDITGVVVTIQGPLRLSDYLVTRCPPGCARRGAWRYCRTGARWSASGTRAGSCASPSPEGRLAPDNPFPESLAFTTGHRNVQGLTFDRSGRLFATELGQHAFDEVNLLEAGNVYGWPRVEGDAPASGTTRPVLTGTPDEASPSRAVIARCSLRAAALRGNRL